MSTKEPQAIVLPNGAALAAFAAAAIGAFAMGLISLLNAIGVLPVPTLYGPAGGVTGRTTLAALIWLIAWAILHSRWKARNMETGRIRATTIVLTVLGIVLALPPTWSFFG
jgi:multisubunit Na+/H+ antiporter MnhG subunit